MISVQLFRCLSWEDKVTCHLSKLVRENCVSCVLKCLINAHRSLWKPCVCGWKLGNVCSCCLKQRLQQKLGKKLSALQEERGMDVSIHFLCTPSRPKSALLWPFKATEICWRKIHLLSSGEAEAAQGRWQEWWGDGGKWCQSLGDGREALSVGCAPGAGTSSESWTDNLFLQEMFLWPGRMNRWMLQPRLCGRAGNQLLTKSWKWGGKGN